jgi:hypothetical protein
MTEIKENLRYLQVTLRYHRNTIAELIFLFLRTRRGRYSNVILEGVLLVARPVPAYGIPIVAWTLFSVRAVRGFRQSLSLLLRA